ncbi:predicted transposase [Desulforapulum autotrophicum HRM2]|uniref:Predicted transposase n=1 Tax=Desulforapulum autotrophicum (strain ATCC 43914 / DSM 3382 / VKM B-1955 / HRM2) TaxID=177437 RepID=C0QH47_DESAH|nr:hypothetical protein [Desulforapulum autotrophicum]ACN15696.1 predicted transposase [Desulforapulum autotrophicum HRM2]
MTISGQHTGFMANQLSRYRERLATHGTPSGERLKKEHGYAGGFSTVCRYVREAKLRIGIGKQRAFIPLEIDNTGEAEVDWGTTHIILDGIQTKIKLSIYRFYASCDLPVLTISRTPHPLISHHPMNSEPHHWQAHRPFH